MSAIRLKARRQDLIQKQSATDSGVLQFKKYNGSKDLQEKKDELLVTLLNFPTLCREGTDDSARLQTLRHRALAKYP